MSNYVPIAVFAYKRTHHLQRLLSALSSNPEFSQSKVYFFSDGASTEEDLSQVEAVRLLINNFPHSRKELIESESNKGLSRSLIEGITQVLNTYESVIVLEDDLVPSKGFLSFMNEALDKCKDDSVAGVSAFNYEDVHNKNANVFFSKAGSCWGWGTWKDQWNPERMNPRELLAEIRDKKLEYSFDMEGVYPYTRMLEKQAAGEIDSWAISYYAGYFLENKYFLYPNNSLIFNDGLDGSGVHEEAASQNTMPAGFWERTNSVDQIEIKEEPDVKRLFAKALGKLNKRPSFFKRLTSKFKR